MEDEKYKQHSGRVSLSAGLGAFCLSLLLFALSHNAPFGQAFNGTFGIVSGLAGLLLALLALFGCVTACVYGVGGWRTTLGKCGIALSVAAVVLVILLFGVVA